MDVYGTAEEVAEKAGNACPLRTKVREGDKNKGLSGTTEIVPRHKANQNRLLQQPVQPCPFKTWISAGLLAV